MQFPLQTIDQLKPLLQGFRKRAGLTQAAMAEKLGITQQSYAQMESNLGATSVERLYTIMRLLNVQLSFLPSDGKVPTPSSAPDNSAAKVKAKATKNKPPATPNKTNKTKSAEADPQAVQQSDQTKW